MKSVLPRVTVTPSGPQVEIAEWAWRKAYDGQVIYVEGTVTNLSIRAMKSVEIHVIFRDKDKNFLATDWSYADAAPLPPEETTTWTIAAFNLEAVAAVEVSQALWEWAE